MNYTAVDIAADTAIVAASAGRKIKVYAVALSVANTDAAATTSIRFTETDASGTALTGHFMVPADTVGVKHAGLLVMPYSEVGWFVAGTNKALHIDLTASAGTAAIDGVVVWDYLPGEGA